MYFLEERGKLFYKGFGKLVIFKESVENSKFATTQATTTQAATTQAAEAPGSVPAPAQTQAVDLSNEASEKEEEVEEEEEGFIIRKRVIRLNIQVIMQDQKR